MFSHIAAKPFFRILHICSTCLNILRRNTCFHIFRIVSTCCHILWRNAFFSFFSCLHIVAHIAAEHICSHVFHMFSFFLHISRRNTICSHMFYMFLHVCHILITFADSQPSVDLNIATLEVAVDNFGISLWKRVKITAGRPDKAFHRASGNQSGTTRLAGNREVHVVGKRFLNPATIGQAKVKRGLFQIAP
jgi:hypothetical protein